MQEAAGHANEKQEEFDTPDGAVCGGAGVPAGGAAGPMGRASPRLPGGTGGDGLRQGPLHRRHRPCRAGDAAGGAGKGSQRHGNGHGAGVRPGDQKRPLYRHGRDEHPGHLRAGGGVGHLYKLSRPLAPEEGGQAPADGPEVSGDVLGYSAGGGPHRV